MNSRVGRYVRLSLLSSTAMVMLAAINHHDALGPHALILGALIGLLLWALLRWFRRTGNRGVLWMYGLLNAFVIVEFGLVDGLWRHTMKMLLVVLHNGYLPPVLARLFPPVEGLSAEVTGILTFLASMLAAHSLHQFLRAVRLPTTQENQAS